VQIASWLIGAPRYEKLIGVLADLFLGRPGLIDFSSLSHNVSFTYIVSVIGCRIVDSRMCERSFTRWRLRPKAKLR
jgi:hypothetical protein